MLTCPFSIPPLLIHPARGNYPQVTDNSEILILLFSVRLTWIWTAKSLTWKSIYLCSFNMGILLPALTGNITRAAISLNSTTTIIFTVKMKPTRSCQMQVDSQSHSFIMEPQTAVAAGFYLSYFTFFLKLVTLSLWLQLLLSSPLSPGHVTASWAAYCHQQHLSGELEPTCPKKSVVLLR